MINPFENLYFSMRGDKSSWAPGDFPAHLHAMLGKPLARLGFSASQWSGGGDAWEIGFENPAVALTFWWNRQEMDANLDILDFNKLPDDPTIHWREVAPGDGSAPAPPYSLASVFTFLGLRKPGERFFVLQRTPSRFDQDLKRCAKWLPQAQRFFKDGFDIYIPFRRWLVIEQLRYTWEMKGSYQESERVEQQTLDECRALAAAWWEDEDFRSVYQVLGVIETALTPEERERLADAAKRARKQKKYRF